MLNFECWMESRRLKGQDVILLLIVYGSLILVPWFLIINSHSDLNDLY